MKSEDITGVLAFLRHAERLKIVTRTAWNSAGKQESTAEHTWRLSLFALSLRPWFPELDLGRALAIAIVHDLGEAIHGDISAVLQEGAPPKSEQERRDLLRLLEPAPAEVRRQILALWDEYEAAATPEARFIKAVDKLETILQHNQGKNPPDFDYLFNVGYARAATERDPTIAQIRAVLDEETRRSADL